MDAKCLTLESAECDPAAGCIVLHVHGRQPIRFTASIEALALLKVAVQDYYVYAARPPTGGRDRKVP